MLIPRAVLVLSWRDVIGQALLLLEKVVVVLLLGGGRLEARRGVDSQGRRTPRTECAARRGVCSLGKRPPRTRVALQLLLKLVQLLELLEAPGLDCGIQRLRRIGSLFQKIVRHRLHISFRLLVRRTAGESAKVHGLSSIHSFRATWHPLVETERAAADDWVGGAREALFRRQVEVWEQGRGCFVGPHGALILAVRSRALTLKTDKRKGQEKRALDGF